MLPPTQSDLLIMKGAARTCSVLNDFLSTMPSNSRATRISVCHFCWDPIPRPLVVAVASESPMTIPMSFYQYFNILQVSNIYYIYIYSVQKLMDSRSLAFQELPIKWIVCRISSYYSSTYPKDFHSCLRFLLEKGPLHPQFIPTKGTILEEFLPLIFNTSFSRLPSSWRHKGRIQSDRWQLKKKKIYIDNNEGVCEVYTSWWFQPIWKILVKLDHFP